MSNDTTAEKLRTLNFHVNESAIYLSIYWHGDFVLSLTRFGPREPWRLRGSIISAKEIIRVCELKAYNLDVKRIYLR